MAAGQHNPSRRALLGAAVVVPFLPCHPGLDDRVPPSPGRCLRGPDHGSSRSPSREVENWTPDDPESSLGRGEEWREALAAYRAAEAEVRGFEVRNAGRAFVAEDPLDEVYGELGDVMYDALRRLLRSAAPDIEAVAVKLGLVVEHEVGTLSGGEACLEAIREDARRLAGGVTKAAS